MRVLVTGGAGFIGSLTAQRLADRGDAVVVLDDLSTGHRTSVPEAAIFYEGSIGDARLLAQILTQHQIDACMHFAGLIASGESMAEPARYLSVNVGATLVLLEALVGAGCRQLVVSSSAGVYGEPHHLPISEDHPTNPESVYGATKLMVEQAVRWLGDLGQLRYVALRYFNAAGGVPGHVENHHPETHLIPLALAAAAGDRPALQLYGDDYPTRDGTCVRDYIHVADLAAAHLAALDALGGGTHALIANLGTGQGYTVAEVVAMVEQVTGLAVPVEIAPRRPGDWAAHVASCDLARQALDWVPTQSSLEQIVADAWAGYRQLTKR